MIVPGCWWASMPTCCIASYWLVARGTRIWSPRPPGRCWSGCGSFDRTIPRLLKCRDSPDGRSPSLLVAFVGRVGERLECLQDGSGVLGRELVENPGNLGATVLHHRLH